MVAARAGTAWINPVMTPAPPMDYARPYVAGQTGNEQVTQEVTYPGPPPGFSPLVLWGFPEYFTWDPNATVQTVDFTVYMPVQVDTGTLQSLMQDLHDQLLSGFNDDILAYEIDYQPLAQIQVPSQICINDPLGGSPLCLGVPNQLCLPIVGCINLGGSTLEVGEAYRIWMLVGFPSSSAGYRTAVRAQATISLVLQIIPLLMAVVALFPTAVVEIKNLFSGTTTLATAQQAANTVAGIPGNIIGGAFQGPDTTILILGLGSVAVGVLAIVMGQQPPPSNPVALSGNLSAPGGLGIGGGFSSGGGGSQQQSRSRR